jgi:hypothetical protein
MQLTMPQQNGCHGAGYDERRPVARCADLLFHNRKVRGSNPVPATKIYD